VCYSVIRLHKSPVDNNNGINNYNNDYKADNNKDDDDNNYNTARGDQANNFELDVNRHRHW